LASEKPNPKKGRENSGASAMKKQDRHLDAPTALTCPECGGAMKEEQNGKITQFRCHIGHVMTGEILSAAQRRELEDHLSAALRTLNERLELCRKMAEKCRKNGDGDGEKRWKAAAKEAENRIVMVRELAETEWLQPESC